MHVRMADGRCSCVCVCVCVCVLVREIIKRYLINWFQSNHVREVLDFATNYPIQDHAPLSATRQAWKCWLSVSEELLELSSAWLAIFSTLYEDWFGGWLAGSLLHIWALAHTFKCTEK